MTDNTPVSWHIDEIIDCGTYIDVLAWYGPVREFSFVLGALEYPRVWFIERNQWNSHIFWDIHNIERNAELLHHDNRYDLRMARDIALLFSKLSNEYFL